MPDELGGSPALTVSSRSKRRTGKGGVGKMRRCFLRAGAVRNQEDTCDEADQAERNELTGCIRMQPHIVRFPQTNLVPTQNIFLHEFVRSYRSSVIPRLSIPCIAKFFQDDCRNQQRNRRGNTIPGCGNRSPTARFLTSFVRQSASDIPLCITQPCLILQPQSFTQGSALPLGLRWIGLVAIQSMSFQEIFLGFLVALGCEILIGDDQHRVQGGHSYLAGWSRARPAHCCRNGGPPWRWRTRSPSRILRSSLGIPRRHALQ